MKVYVWREVLSGYDPGIAVAVARSVEEAREAILKNADEIAKDDLTEDLKATPEVHDLPYGTYCWGGS